MEGDAGGPLTDAARSFDRAGREVNRRVPARTDTGTALRSAGRMIALLAPGANHAGARVAAVTTALAALTAAVADLRQSQNRLQQAEAAYASADRLRTVAPQRVPAVQTPPRPRNAADLAAMSFARKPGKVRPYEASPAAPKKGTDSAGTQKTRPRPRPGARSETR